MFLGVYNKVLLPYLTVLNLNGNKLTAKCLNKFVKNHKQIKRLSLSNNFLETGLFDKILSKNLMILEVLEAELMQLGNDEFAKFAFAQR